MEGWNRNILTKGEMCINLVVRDSVSGRLVMDSVSGRLVVDSVSRQRYVMIWI